MLLTFGKYKIITDDKQFIVQERKEVQPSKLTKRENVGKKYWDNVAYFGSLRHALNFLSRSILLNNNDLDDIINGLRQLENKIDDLIKGEE